MKRKKKKKNLHCPGLCWVLKTMRVSYGPWCQKHVAWKGKGSANYGSQDSDPCSFLELWGKREALDPARKGAKEIRKERHSLKSIIWTGHLVQRDWQFKGLTFSPVWEETLKEQNGFKAEEKDGPWCEWNSRHWVTDRYIFGAETSGVSQTDPSREHLSVSSEE